ncbi:MAG: hypothetical protein U9N81_05810 [Bacillota bacterium]|nr:hypothetical protein [Bacillota bacterium]
MYEDLTYGVIVDNSHQILFDGCVVPAVKVLASSGEERIYAVRNDSEVCCSEGISEISQSEIESILSVDQFVKIHADYDGLIDTVYLPDYCASYINSGNSLLISAELSVIAVNDVSYSVDSNTVIINTYPSKSSDGIEVVIMDTPAFMIQNEGSLTLTEDALMVTDDGVLEYLVLHEGALCGCSAEIQICAYDKDTLIYLLGEIIEVQVCDQDKNINSDSADSLIVHVSASSSPTEELELTLMETGDDTGSFSGAVEIKGGEATGDYPVINAEPNE